MKVTTFGYDWRSGWSQPFPTPTTKRPLIIVFGGSKYVDDPSPLLVLGRRYPDAIITGCSTSGEILGEKISDDGLAIALVDFESSHFKSAVEPISSADESFDVGKKLAGTLKDDGLTHVLVLSCGLHVNGSHLARGLNSVLPPEITVTGGLAGDGTRFEKTWIIANGLPTTGCVSAIGFYGDSLKVGHGSKGGWDQFGPERLVTRSEGNVLFEIDNEPALALYKRYLGKLADGLPSSGLLFPLALRERPEDVDTLVRTILAVDEEQQSLTFAGDIPEGWLVQLMRASFDELICGAEDAAQLTREADPNEHDSLVIAISCVGRRLVLAERAEEELEATLEVLPHGIQQVGFYSYGEISPYVVSGQCDLHNQTMTLTTFREA